MKTIFEVSYFNQIWGYVCIIMVALVFIVIFSKPITSFFVNMRSEVLCVLNKQDKSDDFKNGYLFLCRMIPLAVIIAIVGCYISHLIPVFQYRLNDQYEHTTGIVENFEKDRGIESFEIDGVCFRTLSGEAQLTYSGGLIREGMQVYIEYYNDSSTNRIFKIIIYE